MIESKTPFYTCPHISVGPEGLRAARESSSSSRSSRGRRSARERAGMFLPLSSDEEGPPRHTTFRIPTVFVTDRNRRSMDSASSESGGGEARRRLPLGREYAPPPEYCETPAPPTAGPPRVSPAPQGTEWTGGWTGRPSSQSATWHPSRNPPQADIRPPVGPRSVAPGPNYPRGSQGQEQSRAQAAPAPPSPPSSHDSGSGGDHRGNTKTRVSHPDAWGRSIGCRSVHRFRYHLARFISLFRAGRRGRGDNLARTPEVERTNSGVAVDSGTKAAAWKHRPSAFRFSACTRVCKKQ